MKKNIPNQKGSKISLDDFDSWLQSQSDVPHSKNFTKNTLKRIEDEKKKQPQSALLFFYKYAFPLASAALLCLSLGVFWGYNGNDSVLSPSKSNEPIGLQASSSQEMSTAQNVEVIKNKLTQQQSISKSVHANPDLTTDTNAIYTDAEYLAFEELLLIQSNLESFASLEF